MDVSVAGYLEEQHRENTAMIAAGIIEEPLTDDDVTCPDCGHCDPWSLCPCDAVAVARADAQLLDERDDPFMESGLMEFLDEHRGEDRAQYAEALLGAL